MKERIRTRSRQEILDAASVSLYTQNTSSPFVEYMISHVGYPIWEESIVDEGNSSLVIPFVDTESNYTMGYLIGESREDLSEALFDFVFIERRFLELGEEPSVLDIDRLHLFIVLDYLLFENPDDSWAEIYNQHKGNLKDDILESRNTHITVCGCVHVGMALNEDDVLETRSCPPLHEFQCWVETHPCHGSGSSGGGGSNNSGNCVFCTGKNGWNLPSGPNIAGGGGNSPLNPTFILSLIHI